MVRTMTSQTNNVCMLGNPTLLRRLDSLRTDTQITFSLHFTPLGIRLSPCVAQPGAFLVLETIILGHYSTHC